MSLCVCILVLHVIVLDVAVLLLYRSASTAVDKAEAILPFRDVISNLDFARSDFGLGRLYEDVLPEEHLLALHSMYHRGVKFFHRLAAVDPKTGALQQFVFDTSTNREFTSIVRSIYESNVTLAPSERLVVDIGAMDGISGSNSYNFIALGWNGVLVEPFPRHFVRLTKNLKEYMKMADQAVHAVNAVVSDRNGPTKLALYGSNSKTSNTVVPGLNKNKTPVGFLDVESYTVARLVEEFNIPRRFGVLTVDAEGIDDVIVRQFMDEGIRPVFVILELRNDYVEFSERPDQFLSLYGYTQFAVVGSNVIWQHL